MHFFFFLKSDHESGHFCLPLARLRRPLSCAHQGNTPFHKIRTHRYNALLSISTVPQQRQSVLLLQQDGEYLESSGVETLLKTMLEVEYPGQAYSDALEYGIKESCPGSQVTSILGHKYFQTLEYPYILCIDLLILS